MGDVVFTRGERLEAPEVSTGELTLQAPPGLPRPTPRPLVQIVLPVVLVVAVVGMVVVMMRTGMMRNPMFMLFPVMMAVSAVGMLAGSLSGGNKTGETDELRKDYLRYLGQTREAVQETAAAQRAASLEALAARADAHATVKIDAGTSEVLQAFAAALPA